MTMTIQRVQTGARIEKRRLYGKYNATITITFLSLIAERRSQSDSSDLGSFLASNPDLLEKDVLKGWYSEERLNSPLAREQFLLPNKAHDSHMYTGGTTSRKRTARSKANAKTVANVSDSATVHPPAARRHTDVRAASTHSTSVAAGHG